MAQNADGETPPGGMTAEPATGVTAEAVTWAFRLLVGREPDSREVEAHRSLPDLDTLRRAFANTWEFFAFYDAMLDGRLTYGMPLFMMRPPADPSLPWRFEPPTLEQPVSQFCTAAQFDEPAFAEIAEAMGMTTTRSRRNWEQIWIVSTLATAGLIGPGFQALGFGVGRDRVAALLASRGVTVIATDQPDAADALRSSGARLAGLFHPEIIQIDDFERLVDHRPLDMTAIPPDLDDCFDLCWSVSALNRLGSLEAGTAFVEASLRPLKPGGVAVHTMEFNLRSDVATADTPNFALPRRRDIEALALRLLQAGHAVFPLNLHPGCDPLDEEVATVPGGPPRLKQRHGALVTGAFGLAIRKAG